MPRWSGDDGQTIWLPRETMRERSRVPTIAAEGLDAVRGYMVPRYQEEMPDGRRVAELRADDVRRVAEGYGCGECLAKFDRRYQNCPGCGHALDPNTDIVDWRPDYWRPSPPINSREILRKKGSS